MSVIPPVDPQLDNALPSAPLSPSRNQGTKACDYDPPTRGKQTARLCAGLRSQVLLHEHRWRNRTRFHWGERSVFRLGATHRYTPHQITHNFVCYRSAEPRSHSVRCQKSTPAVDTTSTSRGFRRPHSTTGQARMYLVQFEHARQHLIFPLPSGGSDGDSF